MSGAISAIVGVVEIAAGAIIDIASQGALSWIGTPLISAGASTLLGYAVSLLVDPRKAPLIPIGASYSGTLEQPLVVVYLRD
jgi:hypothetical protein